MRSPERLNDRVDLARAAARGGRDDGAAADRGAHEHHAPRAVGAQPARRGQHLVLAAGAGVVEARPSARRPARRSARRAATHATLALWLANTTPSPRRGRAPPRAGARPAPGMATSATPGPDAGSRRTPLLAPSSRSWSTTCLRRRRSRRPAQRRARGRGWTGRARSASVSTVSPRTRSSAGATRSSARDVGDHARAPRPSVWSAARRLRPHRGRRVAAVGRATARFRAQVSCPAVVVRRPARTAPSPTRPRGGAAHLACVTQHPVGRGRRRDPAPCLTGRTDASTPDARCCETHATALPTHTRLRR